MTQAERGPLSGPEEGEKEADHAEACSGRAGDHRTTCETVTVAARTAAARRQGRGARAEKIAVQP